MASENTDRSNGNLRPWKKGQSGNPGGRKKMPEDAKAMLKAATPAAVKLLVDTLNNPEEKTETRVRCAETVQLFQIGAVAPRRGAVPCQLNAAIFPECC